LRGGRGGDDAADSASASASAPAGGPALQRMSSDPTRPSGGARFADYRQKARSESQGVVATGTIQTILKDERRYGGRIDILPLSLSQWRIDILPSSLSRPCTNSHYHFITISFTLRYGFIKVEGYSSDIYFRSGDTATNFDALCANDDVEVNILGNLEKSDKLKAVNVKLIKSAKDKLNDLISTAPVEVGIVRSCREGMGGEIVCLNGGRKVIFESSNVLPLLEGAVPKEADRLERMKYLPAQLRPKDEVQFVLIKEEDTASSGNGSFFVSTPPYGDIADIQTDVHITFHHPLLQLLVSVLVSRNSTPGLNTLHSRSSFCHQEL
jgi:hypothetical protein